MRRVAAIISCVFVLGACASSSKSGSPDVTRPATATTTSTVVTGPRSIGHVFVITIENEEYDATWGLKSRAFYLNHTLVPKGKLLTQYFGVAHASLGNYIAQISGQAPNPATQADCVTYTNFSSRGTGKYGQALGQGCVYPVAVKTVGDQLTAAHKTWRAYQDNMGASCRHPDIGQVDPTVSARLGDMYTTRHNPFVYFHSIIDSPTCAKNVVGYRLLATDLKSVATTPNLVYITPNLCHDGHDAPCIDGKPGGLISADGFLAVEVPKILASPAFKKDGLLVVTVDEASIANAAACCQSSPPGCGRTRSMRRRTTTTPCCAASRTCSGSRISASRARPGWLASARMSTTRRRRRSGAATCRARG